VKSVSSVIEINSSPDQVWAILADLAGYPSWNPFIPRIEGRLQHGERLAVQIRPPGRKGMTLRPTVTALVPGRRLSWLGRLLLPGIFDGEHRFEIDDLGGRVRFRQEETFRGILVPIMPGLLDSTRSGFEEMNRALKARAEEDMARPGHTSAPSHVSRL
jgi:hypothetical protein